MKDYLIAWVLTGLMTLAGLFTVGFAIGLIGAITGSISDPDQLEQSGAFNVLVLLAMAIINFFAFRRWYGWCERFIQSVSIRYLRHNLLGCSS